MKVLDAGSGDKTQCRVMFPEAEIIALDINPDTKPDVVADLTQPLPEELHSQFDVVMLSHVLEHVDRLKVISTVRNLSAALKEGGELYVMVPALEWAALEVLKPKSSNALIAFLYGSQDSPWQYHRCGFTLLMLRQVCQLAGLTPVQASQGTFSIDMESGIIQATQNIVVARRNGHYKE